MWGNLRRIYQFNVGMESPLLYAGSPVLLTVISDQCIKPVLSFHDITPEYTMGILHFFDASRLCVFGDIFVLDIMQGSLYQG